MKPFGALLLVAAVLAGGDAATDAVAAGRSCRTIVSAIERLACFDAEAGTPPVPAAEMATPSTVAPTAQASATAPSMVRVPDIVGLVQRNESRRKADHAGVLLLRVGDAIPGQDKVVISAPALAGSEPRPLLAISCLQNISRLQLITAEPLDVSRVSIRVLLDGRPISDRRPWQVVEDGTVTDAGRGLVAIEQLRHLTRASQQMQLESDHAAFHGLSFDTAALHELMAQQREACHW
ncbi:MULTISPECIES: type VI secretion system-associated protein VasI [unclassified Achromobacter]|uniref:type VI secretion system-associated protein VasI n=1 Tax=unclassified Achromobacter TaxID=2626865 RepID=UPI001C43D83E|nr:MULTISPECIES: type VI secretion system-associated protein VasI [unclassified Achromobacter]MBV7499462.1 type VI secretion system-associated protein TagO [Achromobacter sp. ACM05]MCG7327468.1 type VI secretion system-associated protein TagO [Achromobacter sp. ACRQX]